MNKFFKKKNYVLDINNIQKIYKYNIFKIINILTKRAEFINFYIKKKINYYLILYKKKKKTKTKIIKKILKLPKYTFITILDLLNYRLKF